MPKAPHARLPGEGEICPFRSARLRRVRLKRASAEEKPVSTPPSLEPPSFCCAEPHRGAKCPAIVFAEATMEFDPTMLVATPKNRLETRAHYEGAARAE